MVRNYFVFTEMEDVYGETIRFCYQNIRRLVIDNTPTDHLDNILHAVRILLTIAFAHPDPESLARLGHDPVHYIPGVRFFECCWLVSSKCNQMSIIHHLLNSKRR